MKEQYSPYKIVHHLDKISQLKDGKQTNPLQVQIVPSNICNQSCHFCAYRMKDYLSNEQFNDKDFLSYQKIIQTLNRMIGMNVNAVQYTGGGEPLVHPKIKDIFRHTLKNNIQLALVSNGQALDEQLCQMLSQSRWVRISVDSGSKQLYGFLRRTKRQIFDKVIKNIKNLIKYNKRSIIGVGFVVQRQNYKDIYKAAQIFKDVGVNNFRISAAFTPMGYQYFKDFEKQAKQLSTKAQQLSDDKFTVFNLFNDRVKDNFQGIQNYDFCGIKQLLAYVGADYNVYTCCTLAYNKKGLIGSIKDKSFQDLWYSQQKKDKFNSHNPSKHCNFPCMYKNKNDFINYCTKKDAKHINFI